MREESKYVDCKMANMISNDWSDFICQKNIYLFTSLDEWALIYAMWVSQLLFSWIFYQKLLKTRQILANYSCLAPSKFTDFSKIGKGNVPIKFFEHRILMSLFLFFPRELNFHWKLGQQAPSFGSILAYLETTA